MTSNPISSTLKSLILFSKQSSQPITWTLIRDEVLAPLYFEEMTLLDVVSIVIRAYQEAASTPSLRIGHPDVLLLELISAPIKGFYSIDKFGPLSIETAYSVEAWYNSMLKVIMSNLRQAIVTNFLNDSNQLKDTGANLDS